MLYIKRLHNEILELYNIYDDFMVIYKKPCVDFVLMGRWKFVIPKKYPFSPPMVYSLKTSENEPCDISYIDSLKTKSSRIIHYLDHYYDGCICCKSILVPDNWSPTYYIQKIVQEIELFNEVKCAIKYNLVLDDIIHKYIVKYDEGHIGKDYTAKYIGLGTNIKGYIFSFIDVFHNQRTSWY